MNYVELAACVFIGAIAGTVIGNIIWHKHIKKGGK